MVAQTSAGLMDENKKLATQIEQAKKLTANKIKKTSESLLSKITIDNLAVTAISALTGVPSIAVEAALTAGSVAMERYKDKTSDKKDDNEKDKIIDLMEDVERVGGAVSGHDNTHEADDDFHMKCPVSKESAAALKTSQNKHLTDQLTANKNALDYKDNKNTLIEDLKSDDLKNRNKAIKHLKK